jgi:UDP-2,3-diacylglucosamine hydrolase
MSLPRLGIIAGNGDLPDEIANIYSKNGGDCFIASIDKDRSYSAVPCKNFALGSVGAILEYFEENKVKDVILIGGINRPDLKSLKVDWGGTTLLASIVKQTILGDDNVLKIVMTHIEKKGFNIVSPFEILEINTENQIFSIKQPSIQDDTDIELGSLVLKTMGGLDVGQSVVVCDAYVVGIEAAEGTDNLINRCSMLRKKSKGGVLVKRSKLAQDMRLDVPVVGPKTILNLAKCGFNGLAIERHGVIIVNPEETKKLLDENGLFLKTLEKSAF